MSDWLKCPYIFPSPIFKAIIQSVVESVCKARKVAELKLYWKVVVFMLRPRNGRGSLFAVPFR